MTKKTDNLAADNNEVVEEMHVDFEDGLKTLIDSEATLSEEFKDKAAILFETAIANKIKTEVTRLEEQHEEQLNEAIEAQKVEMSEKVDKYLNYVVSEWMEENRLAVESGIKNEIAEAFMSAMHNVFSEHYVDVPESKVDLIETMEKRIGELEGISNKAIVESIALKEELNGLNKELLIRENSRDLSESQLEKLKELLAEAVYEDKAQFNKKISVIKESYFKEKNVATDLAEEKPILDDGNTQTLSPLMQKYLDALSKGV